MVYRVYFFGGGLGFGGRGAALLLLTFELAMRCTSFSFARFRKREASELMEGAKELLV